MEYRKIKDTVLAPALALFIIGCTFYLGYEVGKHYNQPKIFNIDARSIVFKTYPDNPSKPPDEKRYRMVEIDK